MMMCLHFSEVDILNFCVCTHGLRVPVSVVCVLVLASLLPSTTQLHSFPRGYRSDVIVGVTQGDLLYVTCNT